jgi:hypothetical protein
VSDYQWNPHKGVSGNDPNHLASIPGILMGGPDASTFSNPPTLAQVNSAFGMQQIIAACNYLDQYHTPLPLIYRGGGAMVMASMMNIVRTRINLIRCRWGAPIYAWTNATSPAVGPMLEQDIFEFRKSLDRTSQVFWNIYKQSSGPGTTLYPPGTPYYCNQGGQVNNADFLYYGTALSEIRRAYLQFWIPPGVSNADAQLNIFLWRRDGMSLMGYGVPSGPNANQYNYNVRIYAATPVNVGPGGTGMPATDDDKAAQWTGAMSLLSEAGAEGLMPDTIGPGYECTFTLHGISSGPLTICCANSNEVDGIMPTPQVDPWQAIESYQSTLMEYFPSRPHPWDGNVASLLLNP